MVKQIALALTGVVLAFAVCRAAPVYEKVCKAPNVPRVVVDTYVQQAVVCGAPTMILVCPIEGVCYYEFGRPATTCDNTVKQVLCLTPAEHEAALARSK